MSIRICRAVFAFAATALVVSCSSSEPSKTGTGSGGQAGAPAPSSTGGHFATGGNAGAPIGGAGGAGGGAPGRGVAGAGGAAGGAGAAGAHGDAGAAGGSAGNVAVVVSPASNGKQIISGPYNAPPEASRMAGVPQGTLDTFTFNTSTVFPNTSREVDIFIPAQYVPGTEVPFMVIQDGVEQLSSYHTNIVLENLIHEKRLPVMAALFVNRPDDGPERSLEYDCLDDDYARFIATDILPLVQKRHPELKLTGNPDGRGALGKSSGGPAAFTLGWRHPDLYRRILTLNGSFVNLCKDGPGASTYPGLVQMTDPPKPLRVYMFSGSNDNAGFAAGNQALADALQAKGYTWRYVYGNGSSHDNKYAASMIVEALLWTWAGYPL